MPTLGCSSTQLLMFPLQYFSEQFHHIVAVLSCCFSVFIVVFTNKGMVSSRDFVNSFAVFNCSELCCDIGGFLNQFDRILLVWYAMSTVFFLCHYFSDLLTFILCIATTNYVFPIKVVNPDNGTSFVWGGELDMVLLGRQ